MAEVALTSIAKSALTLFTSLAKDEFLLQWKSREELKKLEKTIETIRGFLRDADKLQSKEFSVQTCLSRLREVMYDADDFFDALAAKALHKKTMTGNAFTKEVRIFFSKSSNQLRFTFETAHQVKALRESLDDIAKDMKRFSFLSQSSPLENHRFIKSDKHKTSSVVNEEDVIGRDMDRDRIINMLLSHDDRSFSVVAIIGFGGLGKTTLAQYVYNNDKVQQGFDVCLWACINDLSNLGKVLTEILLSKFGKQDLDLGLEMLQEKLRDTISSKKFLVVLDDVWDECSVNWLKLEAILRRFGNHGSRVLVTTRSVKVAECLGVQKSYCVDLEVLSEESAWSLFVRRAFVNLGELSEYPELEPLGKKIVGRCGNVPLAIIVIGSLLGSKKREERIWSDFLENELGKTPSASDCGGETPQKSINDVLMVSYKYLDANLKLCFAYCSLFPKGYEFDKDELVYLWLSQGFIKPSAGNNKQSLEELGEAYFFHLVDRCFFQGVKCGKNEYFCNVHVGNPLYRHSAKMHDLLHDLAVDVAKTENILIDKDFINGGEGGNFRHICIGSDVVEFFSFSNLVSDPNTVRSILCEDRRSVRIFPGSVKMLTRFRALRALCLSSMGIHSISDSIGELIHLRYLDLSNNDLKHLPNSICKLHHLITLVLQDCKLLESLPQKLDRLINLRHLYIDGCLALESMPNGLMALTSLVNLDRLIVDRRSGGLRYLNELNNLCGGVRIELPEEGWLNAVEDAKRSNMSKKHKLTGMDISWGNDLLSTSCAQKKMAEDEAAQVLQAIEPPEKLEHLKISKYGGEKLSSWFCTLKNVKELCLSGCDRVEYLEVEMKDDPCFPSLKILRLEEMKNLKGWWNREIIHGETKWPSLAKVSNVFIRDCPELKRNMPLFVGVEDLHLIRVDVKLLDISLPPFDSSINKLKKVRLAEINGLTFLQEGQIRHLTALEILDIEDCTDLQWVSRRGLANLTALKELKLGRCCEIVDEDGEMDQIQIEEVGLPWKMLHGLTTLTIPVWDKHFREGLCHLRFLKNLEICKFDDEEDVVELASKATLHGLHTLRIGFDEDKRYDLCKTWIQYLPSLKELWVGGCKELYVDWKSLLINTNLHKLVLYCVDSVMRVGDMAATEQHSQLRHLRIHTTREAKWVHDIPWKSLVSLNTLSLNDIGEMDELPEGIQHLSSLQCLFINGCEKVRSFPDWFPSSLFRPPVMLLQIEGCSLLEQSFPELCALLQCFNAEKDNEHYKLYKSYEDFWDQHVVLKVIKEKHKKKEISVEV